MKNIFNQIIFFVVTLIFVPQANALIFDFEDVYTIQGPKTSFNSIEEGNLVGYKDIRWNNYEYIKKGTYPFPTNNWPVNGFTVGMIGDYAISNHQNGGNTRIWFEDLRKFDFNGALFTSGYWDNQYLDIIGYKLNEFGNSIFSAKATYLITAYQPTWIDINFYEINELEIYGYEGPLPGESGPETNKFGGNFRDASIIIDNFRINESPVVPEPATLVLFGTGLLGAFIRRNFVA